MKNNSKLLPSIIGCLLVQLCVGILYLWSVFKSPVIAAFDWNLASANMVASYMMFAFVVGNLIGGFFQDRTNPKLVATIGCVLFCGGIFLTSLLNSSNISFIYLTYSGMAGIGCGFAYGSVISCVQKWFPHRRGFASGLSVSAFGLSTVVFGPVAKWLMGLPAFGDNGVSMAFRTLSIVFFCVTMVSCLFIRLPSEEYLKSLNLPAGSGGGELSKTPGQAVKAPNFWFLTLACFFLNYMWNIMMPLIRDLGMSRGLSETFALTVVSLTGIANACGRLTVATISDKIGRGKTIQLISAVTVALAVLLIFIGGPFYLVVILALAFCFGGGSSTFPAICTDLFGPKYSGTNYGLSLLSLGFSSIVFNALSNTLYNATGSYAASFIAGAVASFLPLLCMIPINKFYKLRAAK